MTARGVVWLAVCVALVLAFSLTTLPGWVFGLVVAAALALGIPLSVKRNRQEATFVRTVWRALTSR